MMDRNKYGYCKRQHKKQKWYINLLPDSVCFFLVQVIPLLTHVLVIEFLFPGLSPKAPSVITILSHRKCLYFPPVTLLWTKEMIVSHSLALFCGVNKVFLIKQDTGTIEVSLKLAAFTILTPPQAQRRFGHLSRSSHSIRITTVWSKPKALLVDASNISCLRICQLVPHTSRQRVSGRADNSTKVPQQVLSCSASHYLFGLVETRVLWV